MGAVDEQVAGFNGIKFTIEVNKAGFQVKMVKLMLIPGLHQAPWNSQDNIFFSYAFFSEFPDSPVFYHLLINIITGGYIAVAHSNHTVVIVIILPGTT